MLNVEEEREADIVAVGGVEVPVMGELNEEIKLKVEENKKAYVMAAVQK